MTDINISTWPADVVRRAAARLAQVADDMADHAAAQRADGQIAADYGHGDIHPEWAAAWTAARAILAANETTTLIKTRTETTVTDMYERAYWDIQEALDEALGSGPNDGAGQGIAADVWLLVQRYTDLKAACLATGDSSWQQTITEIESSPLRCAHGLPVDDECRQCLADVMASMRENTNEQVSSGE